MKRSCWILAAMAVVCGVTPSLHAGWPHYWLGCYHSAYMQNKVWPEPYNYTDRARTYAPFAVMECNGWRRQNLMGDHHFTPDSSDLTPAGKLKARWILTQTPPNRRTIFVQGGESSDHTRARIDAVQEWAIQLLPSGQLPDVQETHLIAEGRPAATVDQNMVKFRESAPLPQLPAATAEQ